jgi:hypothetical protein
MTESTVARPLDGCQEMAPPSGALTTWAADALWALVVFAVLLSVVVALRNAAAQHVAPYIPLWADQTQYLTEAYKGYDLIRDNGLIAGTIQAVRQPRAQGWLFQTTASLYMQLVGANRVTALDVNLALLLLWLGVTSYAMKRAFGISVSLVTLGLLLCSAAIMNDPGGPFDFRLDFAAMCLWGALLALIATSDDRPGLGTQVAIVLLGVALIVTRFISIFYLLPFGGLVVIASVVRRVRRETSWRRWWSWMIPVVAVWTMLGGILIVLNFEMFSGYYVRGHLTGDEVAIRRLSGGLLSSWDDLAYYPRLLWNFQLQSTFSYAAGAVLVLALTLGLYLGRSPLWPAKLRRSPDPVAAPKRQPLGWLLTVALLALIACYCTLTVAQQKSLVVAGTFVPVVVLLIVGLAVRLSPGAWDEQPSRLARLTALMLGPVIVAAGLSYQSGRIGPVLPGMAQLSVLETYARMLDDLVPYIADAGDRPIVWSMDGHYTDLSYSTIQVFLYERTGRWVNLVGGGIGYGAFEHQYTPDELLKAASTSDVLILTIWPPGTRRSFPDDQSIQDQHEILDRYAEANLELLGTYQLNVPYLIYVRPRT